MERTAARRSTAQKWTTLGDANARSAPASPTRRASAASVITTNMSPVSAPADEPTMTQKLSHSRRAGTGSAVVRFGKHLAGVLAEERRTARESPRRRRHDERPARVEEFPAELGVPDGDPEAAVVEMRIVEVLVLRPDRRPRESLPLP